MPHYNYWQSTSPMVGQWIKRKFLKNYTLLELRRWNFHGRQYTSEAHRILIPYTLCMEMLDLIHKGHQGIEKCLLHWRESLFWPEITDDICQTIDKCLICKSTSTARRKLPSVPSEILPHAWHTQGTTLFYWKHSNYLVLGDYFSKYLIVRKLPWSTGPAIRKEILNIITELGKPYTIRSDNGPCYTRTEFKELMKLYRYSISQAHLTFPNLIALLMQWWKL